MVTLVTALIFFLPPLLCRPVTILVRSPLHPAAISLPFMCPSPLNIIIVPALLLLSMGMAGSVCGTHIRMKHIYAYCTLAGVGEWGLRRVSKSI